MRFRVARPLVFCLTIAFITGQLGCSVRAPLSEEGRAQFGTIGVVSARFTPAIVSDTPIRGRDKGAAVGGVLGGTAGAAVGLPMAAACVALAALGPVGASCLAALLVPIAIGALTGGAVGAVLAVPAGIVEELETNIDKTLEALKMQEAVRDYVLKTAQKQTSRSFVLVDDRGPSSPDEKVSYRTLRGKKIDTVLEISVRGIGIQSGGGTEPSFSLMMSMAARVIRTADDSELFVREIGYKGAPGRLTDWAADNATPFRRELERAYQTLAARIVDEVFLLYPVW